MTLAPDIEIDEGTAARFAMYRMLANALGFPSKEFHQEVRDGMFRDGASALIEGLPYRLDAADLERLAPDDAYVDFQAEYIRLFDVGVARPPCPLYGGEWGTSRKGSMEDALRFYRFFGLKMNDVKRELPDHVTVELEFMQVMAYTEGTARGRGMDAAPFLRAERDFLERHLVRWWPMLRRKIASQQASSFYDALTSLTDAFLRADLAYARALLASAPMEELPSAGG
jgi:DMSO reductase family type II enzyme chaperone